MREIKKGRWGKIITSAQQMGMTLELHRPSHLGIKYRMGSCNQREGGRRRTAARLGSPRTTAAFTGEDAEADWDDANLRVAPSLIRAVPLEVGVGRHSGTSS